MLYKVQVIQPPHSRHALPKAAISGWKRVAGLKHNETKASRLCNCPVDCLLPHLPLPLPDVATCIQIDGNILQFESNGAFNDHSSLGHLYEAPQPPLPSPGVKKKASISQPLLSITNSSSPRRYFIYQNVPPNL